VNKKRVARLMMGVCGLGVAVNAIPRAVPGFEHANYFHESWMPVGRYELGWPFPWCRWFSTVNPDDRALLTTTFFQGFSGDVAITSAFHLNLFGLAVVTGLCLIGAILWSAVRGRGPDVLDHSEAGPASGTKPC